MGQGANLILILSTFPESGIVRGISGNYGTTWNFALEYHNNRYLNPQI